jgi:hypothetical protein
MTALLVASGVIATACLAGFVVGTVSIVKQRTRKQAPGGDDRPAAGDVKVKLEEDGQGGFRISAYEGSVENFQRLAEGGFTVSPAVREQLAEAAPPESAEPAERKGGR